jgi:hypothetical protein
VPLPSGLPLSFPQAVGHRPDLPLEHYVTSDLRFLGVGAVWTRQLQRGHGLDQITWIRPNCCRRTRLDHQQQRWPYERERPAYPVAQALGCLLMRSQARPLTDNEPRLTIVGLGLGHRADLLVRGFRRPRLRTSPGF